MKLIKIYSSIRINEVYFVKSLLEANDIPAFVWDDATASIAPHYLFGQGGARLMVPEDRAEEALEVIREYEKGQE